MANVCVQGVIEAVNPRCDLGTRHVLDVTKRFLDRPALKPPFVVVDRLTLLEMPENPGEVLTQMRWKVRLCERMKSLIGSEESLANVTWSSS